jgi:hypothetical protein
MWGIFKSFFKSYLEILDVFHLIFFLCSGKNLTPICITNDGIVQCLEKGGGGVERVN